MNKEELKQEAEEKAKKRVNGFKCQENCEKSYVMGALDFAEPRERKIADLEQEKASLELKLEALEDETPWEDIKDKSEVIGQLTKAKELLKMVLDWQCRCGNGHPTWQEVCAKIEQFLSEDKK